ncbi:MAG: hypothetical protein ACTHK7_08850 [Aureliella sp.]
MSLGGILILVLIVISLFVFIYLMVVTARSWGILHTILLSILFIECWTFLFFSANVLDARLTGLKAYTETRDQLAKLQKENNVLTWGGDHISEDQVALVSLNSAVRRLTADRGRVWRNVSKLNIEGEQIRLELAPPAPPPVPGEEGMPVAEPAAAAAPAAAGEVGSIPLEMVLYAFEQVPDENKRPIPGAYLGEFKVAESNAAQVVLRPTAPLEPGQQQAVQNAVTWSLYELLPQDSHDAFAAEGSQPTEDAVFGRMDEALLKNLLSGIPEENGRRQAVIDSYLRDGTPALETDPARNVWFQVEVVKPFDIDVDSDEQANATIGGYFDASGRTVDIRIKRGENKRVSLPEGKQLLLPQKQAGDMIAKGDVKLIQRVYVRPLNAYEKGFGHLKLRRDEVARLIETVNRRMAFLQEANQLGLAMTSEGLVEAQKLSADLEMYKKELAIIENESKLMTDKVNETTEHMKQLFESVHRAHDEIVKSRGS